MFGQVSRIMKPIIVGLKHMFMTPITVKYPYQKVQNLLEENFRYDPKAGIAYPGYKGRHILYLDKCTGCSLCDIACQNIAEAITMVYGFDVTLTLDKTFYDSFKKGQPAAVGIIDILLGSLAERRRAGPRLSSGHPAVPATWSDIHNIQVKGESYQWKLNVDPLYEYRSEAVLENYFSTFLEKCREDGWAISPVEVPGADRENEYHQLRKDGFSLTLSVLKIDEKLPHNKKSYFPQVDYGRCVFCGFCVDACPFYALEMTPEYELSATDRISLVYDPKKLTTLPLTHPPAELGWIERLQLILRGR